LGRKTSVWDENAIFKRSTVLIEEMIFICPTHNFLRARGTDETKIDAYLFPRSGDVYQLLLNILRNYIFKRPVKKRQRKIPLLASCGSSYEEGCEN
jgi:hypothetical protein